MEAATDGPRIRTAVPAPLGLLGFLVLGIGTVLALPEVAVELPHAGRAKQAQFATTCLGILLLTAGYTYLVSRSRPAFDRTWMAWTVLAGAGIAIVKFILSPTAFEKSTGTSLSEFVISGVLVMPLYIGAIFLMFFMVGRKASSPAKSSWAIAVGLAVIAVATRFIVAFVLGNVAEYARDFLGQGLFLPGVVVIVSIAVMQAYDRAGPQAIVALKTFFVMVVAQHVLWVVYMNGLFS